MCFLLTSRLFIFTDAGLNLMGNQIPEVGMRNQCVEQGFGPGVIFDPKPHLKDAEAACLHSPAALFREPLVGVFVHIHDMAEEQTRVLSDRSNTAVWQRLIPLQVLWNAAPRVLLSSS